MAEIILSIIAGLGLFLFAVSNLSETLKTAIGSRADRWISNYGSIP